LKDFLAPITGFFKGHSDQTKGSPKGQSALSLPSIGSGIIVSPEGYILTASNKVKDMTETTVTLSDGRSFKAKLIGADPETNIAVVKIEAENLPVAAFGDSERVRVGALVVAVGNPFGLNHSVSLGVVSATGRTNIGLLEYENFIQTDAVINPGSGGGPLVNIRGEVVGIITGQVSHTGGGGWQGVGFAIPWNTARLVMEQLIAGGEVRRGRLGVSIQDVTEKFAKSLGHNKGAVVTDVKPGSPAEKAGLKVDDIIVEFNEHQIRGGSQLKNLVAQTKPGTNATLKIYRGGETSEVTITVGERKKMLDPAEVQIGR
jgi:serine protease Do